MGANDAAEMLEVAKAECARLERENTELLAEVKRLVNLPAAVQQPNRTELIESLKVAMLGTTDGGFLDSDDPIPAGEMFRLAGEWVERNAAALPIPATGAITEWATGYSGDPESVGNVMAEKDAIRHVTLWNAHAKTVEKYGRSALYRRNPGPWVEVTP